jgi:DmsE family decaheme c-type cytochrome
MAANESRRRLTAFVLSGFLCCASNGLAQPVRAAEQGTTTDAYSALAAFVQSITDIQPKLVRADTIGLPNDAFSELADFVQQIDGEQRVLVAAAKKSTDPWDFSKNAQPKASTKNTTKRTTVTNTAEATYVGSQVCLGCHSAQAAVFAQTLMGKIGRVKKGSMECENCHGPGSLHVKAGGGRNVGGIISFRPEDTTRTAAENNALCLGCHDKGDHVLWAGSAHESRGLACTNCHTVMKNVSRKHQLKTAFEPDTCFQCHKNKRAEMWRTAHMPVREGKITCTNCHNPHGSFAEALLKEATVNDNCYQCHAEKRGPFLWEHAPVRENCLNCHDPHGSINEFMLKISRPRLCQQCHSSPSGHPGNPRNPFSVFAINRECQNCHSQHHGTNSPSGARFQR